MIAFGGPRDPHPIKHRVVPFLGLVANLVMLGSIIYLYIIGNADSKHEAYICFGIAGAWALVSVVYVMLSSRRRELAVA
jgi:hypothetical protein